MEPYSLEQPANPFRARSREQTIMGFIERVEVVLKRVETLLESIEKQRRQ